tara:strand:- start:5142 stop:5465 length:324 start_codon:yes stop_codon:yes gene_type:complete
MDFRASILDGVSLPVMITANEKTLHRTPPCIRRNSEQCNEPEMRSTLCPYSTSLAADRLLRPLSGYFHHGTVAPCMMNVPAAGNISFIAEPVIQPPTKTHPYSQPGW